jgi:8-oxo-dGTP diphosphatase
MAERFTVIPAVYIVLRRDDKILLIRRANTGYHDGFYSLPAGHVDGKEPAIIAAAREAKEEIDVDIALIDLQLVHMMHRVAEEGDHERVDFYFEAKQWQGEPRNAEPAKCDDLAWFAPNELPEKTVPVVRKALEKIAVDINYSDENFTA